MFKDTVVLSVALLLAAVLSHCKASVGSVGELGLLQERSISVSKRESDDQYATQTEYNVLKSLADWMKTFTESPTHLMYSGSAEGNWEYTNNQIFICDNAITHVGSVYGSDGKFTCTKKGLYFFSASVYSTDMHGNGRYVALGRLMKNSVEQAVAETQNGYTRYVVNKWMNFQAAVSTVIKCNANEKVWLQAGTHYRSRVKKIEFTGFLIEELD